MLLLTVFFQVYGLAPALKQLSYMLFLYYFFFGFIREKCFLSDMGQYTMGIYLLHIPIILYALSFVLRRISGDGLMSYVIVMLAGYIISLILAKLLRSTSVGRFILAETFTKG